MFNPSPSYVSLLSTMTEQSLQDIRTIIREEIDAAIERFHQAALDRLKVVLADEDPEDEMAAVIAKMSPDELEALFQRVREHKASETL